jgi:hypothetical protein
VSWTFKSEIEKFSEKREKFVEVNIEKVQKEIGKPNRIDNGIQQYGSRDDLPKFKELIASATDTVDMSGLSFTLMI